MALPPRKSLSCVEVNELIEQHVDGDLPEATVAVVADHLARCTSCAAEADLAAAISHELSRIPQFDVPDALLSTVHRQVAPDRQPEPTNFRRFHHRPAAMLAAAAVVVLVAGVVLVGSRPPRDPQPTEAGVDRATDEARLAFALVAHATRRAEAEVMEGVLRERVLASAVKGLSRSLQFAVGNALEPPTEPEPKPSPERGGLT